ncbi:hypothetical protein HOLleu_13733 [Holothuria leucospilota]|uniref:Uncharacterized protein n=1 Tax=Holothuria leucospilota TaxID=206669 RepID=A0A9Q1HBY4_HOLLE|nr:hypothetical protein HOLleu_13733 [Holothuria leucospilota]
MHKVYKNSIILSDNFCIHFVEVKLQLPQSPPHASYDTSYQGETVLLHTIVTDYTLAAEMSNDLAEQVATSFRLFVVALPVVFGVSDKHGALPLHEFTNSTKKILDPHFIHYSYITQASSLEEKDDGTVTIRLGDDIMVYQVQDKVKCKTKCKVGKDFDETIGDIVTNYPLPFYSGCELLGSQISFCLVLQDVQCELAAVGRDVCVFTSTISSERCATTMKIVNMTGIFRDMFPFLAEIFPAESFEAELIDREHQTGIMFPCVTR